MDVNIADVGILIVSIVALVVSIASIKQSKGNNETSVMNLFFNAYDEFCEILDKNEEAAESGDKKAYDILRWAYKKYCNILEYACIKYRNGELSKKTFMDCLCSEIEDLNVNNYGKKYGQDINDWENIVWVYRTRILAHKIYLERMKEFEEMKKQKMQ